ncbi:hypothetical protein ACFQJC_15035 [Haloferax namakaokahaiae]|uniref:Uncharacterized protein n=1 Tax=Haloferax namakaokahaiae TaxID=1748331 RepID=A0ABD5ZIA5_9EURY
MVGWESQSQHLRTHDLFYSAVYGECDDGLIDIGFHVAGEFTEAENKKRDARCIPSFTLYDNDNLVFVDIFEPGDVTSETIERVSNYNRLDMESVEKYLKRCEFTEDHLTNEEIENYDHLFVLTKEQYSNHQAGDATQRSNLKQLEIEGCIATISPGGELKIEKGGLHCPPIDDALQQGVSVPEKTGKYVYITRNFYRESLAVGICEGIVMNENLTESDVKLNYSDVQSHFNRSIPFEMLEEVFEYLRSINACRVKRGDDAYTFNKYNLETVLSVRKYLASRPIDEELSDDDSRDPGQNRSLEEFSK